MCQNSNNATLKHPQKGRQPHTQPVYIHQCSFHSALGQDTQTIHEIVQQGVNPALEVDRHWLIEGKPTVVGKVQEKLLPLSDLVVLPETSMLSLPLTMDDLSRYDSRNNRLILSALQPIETTIIEVIKKYGANRIAVIIGSSTSGIADGEIAFEHKMKHGAFAKNYHYHQQELGNSADFIARYFGITGPCYTISTACSSSGRAFVTAKRLLKANIVDVVLVGGADTLCHLTLNGFDGLEALSPTLCRPFSADRNGITIGEAAAFMLLSLHRSLDTHQNIQSNNQASPNQRSLDNSQPSFSKVALLGVGDSSDAHHISAPHPDGLGAKQAMQKALDDAGLTAEDIGYINAHGTATPLNDRMESKAIYALFGNQTPVSSTKPLTGHTLGAASIVEAAICWHILTYDLTLPWHTHPFDESSLPNKLSTSYSKAEDIHINLLTEPTKLSRKVILSNSFAFGGNNISLIFGLLSDE